MNEEFINSSKAWIDTRRVKWECFTSGCKSYTSKNHLLQENGILTEIAPNKHVYELLTNRFGTPYRRFEKVGLDKAFYFSGFCSSCDNEIFSKIEKNGPKIPISEIEFCHYAIRPILHEIRKKQGNIEWHKRIKGFPKEYTENRIFQENYAIGLLKYLANIAISVSKGDLRDEYLFVVRKTKRVDICACSIRFVPLVMEMEPLLFGEQIDYSKIIQKTKINIFILFPLGEEAIVISGSHARSHIESWVFNQQILNMEDKNLHRHISDVLIGQIEDWIVSESMYTQVMHKLEEVITNAKADQFSNFYKSYGYDFFA